MCNIEIRMSLVFERLLSLSREKRNDILEKELESLYEKEKENANEEKVNKEKTNKENINEDKQRELEENDRILESLGPEEGQKCYDSLEDLLKPPMKNKDGGYLNVKFTSEQIQTLKQYVDQSNNCFFRTHFYENKYHEDFYNYFRAIKPVLTFLFKRAIIQNKITIAQYLLKSERKTTKYGVSVDCCVFLFMLGGVKKVVEFAEKYSTMGPSLRYSFECKTCGKI